jgi:hypothetical protein
MLRFSSLAWCRAASADAVLRRFGPQVYSFVRDEIKWPAERTVLFGQSIGAHLASLRSASMPDSA